MSIRKSQTVKFIKKEMNEDIFDKIMQLPLLRIAFPLYKRHREVLLYLLFGGCTFVVSIVSFAVANVMLGIPALLANMISWVLAVLLAYVTNRKWVFCQEKDSQQSMIREMIEFFVGRLVTLLVEEMILFVFITILFMSSVPVKIVAQIVVIVLNYVISKLWVFR